MLVSYSTQPSLLFFKLSFDAKRTNLAGQIYSVVLMISIDVHQGRLLYVSSADISCPNMFVYQVVSRGLTDLSLSAFGNHKLPAIHICHLLLSSLPSLKEPDSNELKA